MCSSIRLSDRQHAGRYGMLQSAERRHSSSLLLNLLQVVMEAANLVATGDNVARRLYFAALNRSSQHLWHRVIVRTCSIRPHSHTSEKS